MTSKNLYKNLAVLIILVIMTVAAVGMIYGKALDTIEKKDVVPGGKGATVAVDWEKEYPVDDASKEEISADQAEVQAAQTDSQTGIIGQYKMLFERVKNMVAESCEFVPFYKDFLELSSWVDKISGRTEFLDREVVVLKNGHLTTVEARKDIQTVKETADNIKGLSDWLLEEEIPFLYVQTPAKSDKYDNQFPAGITDFSNENKDALLEELKAREISYLDLRDNIYQQELNLYDMFYKTDHHWRVESGLWAAGEIADKLNKEFGFAMDTSVTDKEKYTEKTYEDWFLGSWGAKVTLGYTDPEDFTIYLPEFATDMRVVNPDKGVDLTGSFEDVVFEYEILDECDYYNHNCYSSILYGNRPLTQITNYNCEGGKRILFIRDSFSLAMAPYFSLMCEQTDLIDVRAANGNFTGSVKTYIKEMKPDAVILMYSPEGYKFE